MGLFRLFSPFRGMPPLAALVRGAFFCLATACLSAACAGAPTSGASANAAPPRATAPANASLSSETIALKTIPRTETTPLVALCWLPLMQRLAADGVDPLYAQALFARMGNNYSHMPMGSKITELFTRKFLRQAPPPPDPGKKPEPQPARPRIYRNVVTEANVARCKEYMAANAVAFSIVEKGYGVPKEVVAALLMVETKLGTYLGKDNAFWSLACMAAADAPEQLTEPLAALPMTPDRLDWVKTRLRERSAWAYNELKALIAHSRQYSLDPLVMPGSIYGAIGICQFMPSNLRPYAVDGDGDGRVDLFDPADAIPSVANYLKGHGWQPGLSAAGQHAVLMRYNKSTIYANTIQALADAINPPPAPDKTKSVKKKPEAKKTAPAKKPAAKAPQKAAKAKASAKPAAKTAPAKATVKTPG